MDLCQSAVAGFIVLERRDKGAARLEEVSPADVLTLLLTQNFAGAVPAPDQLRSLSALVAKTRCQRLIYSSPGAAARLLTVASRKIRPPRKAPLVTTQESNARPNGASYRPAPGVTAEETADKSTFLAKVCDPQVLRLDPIGAALWRLIGEERTEREITDLFAAAFPGENKENLASILRSMLSNLMVRGFVSKRRAKEAFAP
jgi:Coenzyme PQQ synthesis protein D (PqqD)